MKQAPVKTMEVFSEGRFFFFRIFMDGKVIYISPFYKNKERTEILGKEMLEILRGPKDE